MHILFVTSAKSTHTASPFPNLLPPPPQQPIKFVAALYYIYVCCCFDVCVEIISGLARRRNRDALYYDYIYWYIKAGT